MISARRRRARASRAARASPATTSRWRVWRFENTQRASFCQSASDYAVARSAEYPFEHGYRPCEVRNRQPFDRCVVVPAVARTVGEHRTAPRGKEDVHIARPALFLKGHLTARRGDGAGEGAGERARSRGADRLFPTLGGDDDVSVTVFVRDACGLALEIAGGDARRHPVPDARQSASHQTVPSPATDPPR